MARRPKSSRAERTCGRSLHLLVPKPILRQYPIGPYYFDFAFNYHGRGYLLEYDGRQHFEYVPYFHKTLLRFREAQARDKTKTQLALEMGFRVIRLDYRITTLEQVAQHLQEAWSQGCFLYCSCPILYQYLME